MFVCARVARMPSGHYVVTVAETTRRVASCSGLHREVAGGLLRRVGRAVCCVCEEERRRCFVPVGEESLLPICGLCLQALVVAGIGGVSTEGECHAQSERRSSGDGGRNAAGEFPSVGGDDASAHGAASAAA